MSERYQIIHTDNLEWLKSRPDNSIDSVVTDGPYGLGKEPDPVKCLTAWIHHGYYEVGGAGFMNQKWDAFVPQPAFWKEVIRVLKPGGHVLSFSSTRTYDWMVMAMRLAGFEIRDQLCWIYGGGFPKSLDVSKAIDKMAGAEREVVGKHQNPAHNKSGGNSYNMSVAGMPKDVDITIPATQEPLEWQGWGTALSPSHEPIVMARKPLNGTVARNVLEWGTGGLNIDGCRVETIGGRPFREVAELNPNVDYSGNSLAGRLDGTLKTSIANGDTNEGRWPSNLIHDGSEVVLELFPDTKSGMMNAGQERNHDGGYNGGFPAIATLDGTYGDQGSAARYFYCAKPSQYERSLGVQGLHPAGTDNFRQDASLDGKQTAQRGNFHTTVKPVALMHHLVTMVTPPNGICLDPYCGSGTTGIGAMLAGPNIRFIGLDYTEEYIPIIMGRLKNWKKYRQFVEVTPDSPKARQKTTASPGKQQTLF